MLHFAAVSSGLLVVSGLLLLACMYPAELRLGEVVYFTMQLFVYTWEAIENFM